MVGVNLSDYVLIKEKSEILCGYSKVSSVEQLMSAAGRVFGL